MILRGCEEEWVEAAPLPAFKLRGRQEEWIAKVLADFEVYSRLLFVAAGGVGKSSVFAQLARIAWMRHGKRTLILINRESLVNQSAERIRKETGLEVDVEMADQHASPYAAVVVASVQTLGRANRLTGFAADHFGFVIPDEAHMSVSPQWLRCMNRFHYGDASMEEGWIAPADGTYTPLAKVIGFTATPILDGAKNLMNFYQHITVNYPYFQAVQEGWLVEPEQRAIPVKIDMRKRKPRGTDHGVDFAVSDLTAALEPVMEQLADQVKEQASDRKTMAFLPSVECAIMLAAALVRRGMDAVYVSGECDDGDEKTEHFRRGGAGSVLCNAQIYNFGIDFPDVNCIAWFRATLSRQFYLQGIFRATRILPGVIDGLETAEERIAAIAASAKPNFLILDPLFVSDRIDLCDAYDLFAEKPEVKQRMKETGELSQESAEKAERDFLKSLEKAARKAEKKKARVVNPLAWALSLGSERLASYEPESEWDRAGLLPGQIDFLRRHHVDITKITCRGLAQKMIQTLLFRFDQKLATLNQLDFLHKLGMTDQEAAVLTQDQASQQINRLKRERGWS